MNKVIFAVTVAALAVVMVDQPEALQAVAGIAAGAATAFLFWR